MSVRNIVFLFMWYICSYITGKRKSVVANHVYEIYETGKTASVVLQSNYTLIVHSVVLHGEV